MAVPTTGSAIANFQEVVVYADSGKVKLVLDWCGEGNNGDYDPEDRRDRPRLRMELFRKFSSDETWPAGYGDVEDAEEGDWIFLEDSSVLTQLTADTGNEQLEQSAIAIVKAVAQAVEHFQPIGKLCQQLR